MKVEKRERRVGKRKEDGRDEGKIEERKEGRECLNHLTYIHTLPESNILFFDIFWKAALRYDLKMWNLDAEDFTYFT